MTQEEWNQLVALREEMNSHMMAYDCSTREKYTELLVKSLEGKSDPPLRSVSRTA